MKLARALEGCVEKIKPIWLMRQAGRYLPEYRKLREKFPDFIEFCFNSEAVVEATLQPIRRFDFDAAIVFSDILVIPQFLGQAVSFREGVGPVLEEPIWDKILHTPFGGAEVVYGAIKELRGRLDQEKALIGFVGCPWTVASYMISGGKTNKYEDLVRFAAEWPLFDRLLDKLVSVIADHAVGQLRAGADVVQLFESWAAEVPAVYQSRWLFDPAKRIVGGITEQVPDARIIYYGRGVAGEALDKLGRLRISFGLSQGESLRSFEGVGACLQGNLDPQKLLEGGFERDVAKILDFAKNRPFVVNLGHGILPQTPIGNVEKLIELVRCQQ
ncbi:MAG: uroporphyrinogen decarboxylase family protein [Pseudomonadota bacterium]|jgi:uroporphyrinogen decarboxylase|nr:uroporphyrinogen decarboxylase [Alphaproteobacteria bacterium]